MRVGAVIQARMSSSRLPGKVLHPVLGRPLLGYLLDRLRCLHDVDLIAVTTSTGPDDDAVARFCAREEVPCHRGSLDDVALRYLDAAHAFRLDAVVRVTGDSPLLDPELVRHAVRLYRRDPADLVTNVLHRSFPRGQSVEVLSAAALARAYLLMRDPADREHVTRYFYQHPEEWRIVEFQAPVATPTLQLSVDEPQDLARFASLVARMEREPQSYGWEEIVRMMGEPAGTR